MADILIIGAGHNGLVAACYLAKAGHKVAVFEKRPQVGGCAITDEGFFPGFKVSTLSYVNSLFSSQIVDDLDLRKHGYEVLSRNPSSFTPTPFGSKNYLLMGKDKEFNQEQISKFSRKDALKYKEYEKSLNRIAKFINKTFALTPPVNILESAKLIKLLPVFSGLGSDIWNLAKLLGIFGHDAIDFLNGWFESDILKATLLTDATIGAINFSGHVLLHHVMGEAGGARGLWGYQKNGMGGLTKALFMAAKELGVEINTNTGISKINIQNNRAIGITTDQNVNYKADLVISNADPYVTFVKLVEHKNLPNSFFSSIEKMDFSSATMKVNVTLSGLPDFYCKPNSSSEPEEQHIGSIHISPTVDYIVKAASFVNRGQPSESPMLEITIPSTVDKTLAPPGCHVMGIFVQFTPRHLTSDYCNWDCYKEKYLYDNIFPTLRRFISNLDQIRLAHQIISPLDLEREYSLTGGNIFHGAMIPGQLFNRRPLAGYSDYKTPIDGLYLCGAGTHPGGGVMGICGQNAAREIIKHLS